MAKISTYPVDSQVSDSDIILGSDGDNSYATKNYTVATLASYIVPDAKQKIVARTPGISLTAPTRRTITFNTVTRDPTTGSLNYNSGSGALAINPALGEIENTSGGDLIIRIATTTFLNISGGGGGSRTVSYFLEKYDGSWTDLKEVQRTKDNDGDFADSFWSYFKLADGEKFRVEMSTTTDTVTITEGSQFEFHVQ